MGLEVLIYFGTFLLFFVLAIIIAMSGFIIASKLLKIKKNYKTALYVSLLFIFIPLVLNLIGNFINNFILSIVIYIASVILLIYIIQKFYEISLGKSIIVFLIVSVFSFVILFVIIKFALFPLLSLYSGTAYPMITTQSCSMCHQERGFQNIFQSDEIYSSYSINLEDSQKWNFQKGFNQGDLVFLKYSDNIEVGDVIMFEAENEMLLVSRVISTNPITAKGDNNRGLLIYEKSIPQEKVLAKAVFRIPFLGKMIKGI